MKPVFVHRFYLIISVTLGVTGWGSAQNTNPNNESDLRNRASQTEMNKAAGYEQNEIPNPCMNLSSEIQLEKQAVNWKEIVKLNPQQALAWQNYYETTRYSFYSSTSKEITDAEQTELDEIVDEMEKNVPQSFEYHYIKYIHGNHDISLFPHLQKAYEMRPNHNDLYDEMLAYYEIKGDARHKKEFCRKLDADNDWPAHVRNFANNLLQSVAQNAVLITHGEMDTYPLLVAQELNGVRKDVQIISFELLHSEAYRKKIEKELGITIEWKENAKAVVIKKMLTALAGKKVVYVSSTFSPELLNVIKGNLYITGLAMRFSETEYNNLPELKLNWEKNFRYDYLNQAETDAYTKKLNANYIPCLIMMRQLYRDEDDEEKAKKTEKLALKLAAEAGREKPVKIAMGL